MKKLALAVIIFLLVLSTAVIKNTTKQIEDEIFTIKENIRILKSELENVSLEYDYLSSADKLLEYQSLYFENDLIQKKIKDIKIQGVSGTNSVKIILDGNGEMQKIEISDEILKEDKSVIEDLIVAAHNNAKEKLKIKTSEEISKATGGLGIPGFKWPL